MSDRPRRNIVKKEAVDWDAKWDQFAAEETNHNGDGLMDCRAMLYYPSDLKSKGAEEKSIVGTTGAGHAEMVALSAFFSAVCGNNSAKFLEYCEAGVLTIECQTKPVCCHCSAMLGALNIKARNPQTQKTRAKMGSSQWGGLSWQAGQAVAKYLGTSHEDIGTTLAAWKR